MSGGYGDEGGWSPVAVALWVAWGVAFGVLEYKGLKRSGDAWPPLTYVFKRYIPAIAGIALCALLLHHALETYLGD